MQDFEKELLNSLTLMDSGADLELVRGDDGAVTMQVVKSYLEMGAELEEGPRIGTAGALAGEEIQRTMGLSKEQQLEEAKAQAPGLAGAGVAGPIVGSLGVPGDLVGLVMGAVDAIFPEGDQSRIEAFANTVTEISDKFGSGAVKGYIMDQAKAAGLSGDALEALDAGISIGEFGGIGGVAKGIAGKAPAIISKAGDVIEGAGDAAKARMAEGGTTLTSGVDPDPLIAAAGDAVAKFRAPTEKQPGVIAFHGSGADFDEFKLEKIGTGEGAQAYGYGLYFTDSEDIAKFYRDTVSRRKVGIPQSVPDNPENVAENLALDINFNEGVFGDTKQLQINSANPDYDFYIQTLDDNAVETTQSGASKTFEFSDGSVISLLNETVPVFNGKALDSVYTSDIQNVFGAEIADIAQRAKDMGVPGTLEELTDDVTTVLSQLGQGLSSKRDMSAAVESLAPSFQGPPSRFKTIYNHFIEPKSTIETTSTVTELGSKKGKMYKVGLEPKPEDMLDYQGTFADQPKNVQDALKAIGYEVETNRVGQKNSKAEIDVAMKRPMPVILDNLKKMFESQDWQNELYGRGDKILSEKLLEQGVPGIKYRAAGSRAASIDAADAEMNYVIFDDKMIKILEKYGIVGPVAVTGVAASQQEGEGNDAGA